VDGEKFIQLNVPGVRRIGCPVSDDKVTAVNMITAVVQLFHDRQDYAVQVIGCDGVVAVYLVKPGEC
jgi:hypothetical protein